MPVDLKRVKEIFLAAVEKPGSAERQAFLQEACGADEELRRQVEALLRQHEQVSGFLESPPPGMLQTADTGECAAGSPLAPAAGARGSAPCADRSTGTELCAPHSIRQASAVMGAPAHGCRDAPRISEGTSPRSSLSGSAPSWARAAGQLESGPVAVG